uniref:Uncharacterized protein n=1 Tax=Utricularia reniformis TaxID=192314 RepID=A0A1Y0B3H6_9LAMI|nr:hypothetical protein AEK19_MT1709 [Utricularia reniformis]ART31889.1 hypothetical protein AEK19_MT1709 [Utricularia reniformis]
MHLHVPPPHGTPRKTRPRGSSNSLKLPGLSYDRSRCSLALHKLRLDYNFYILIF